MQLKDYQRAALAKLERFLAQTQLRGAAQAFAKVAAEDGNPYGKAAYRPPQGIAGCPHVCLRLPTGGGKTLLAALSIAHVARYLQRDFPVALWMTPSDAIRKQTVEALKKPRHPYRAALDADFGGRVEVWDIEQWRDIRPPDMRERVCVVVSTIQALRITDTNRRKVYAHNENLEAHFQRLAPGARDGLDLERHADGGVKFSFANLLHIHRPLVIVDEAHNAVSALSAELHRRLRPSCILEFTATPKERNNVLVNVPATALRDEEMIKLPIELVEHATWQDAVNGAIATRARLAEVAREEEELIRPVVLYQAQAKNQEVTVERLKKHLLEDENIAPEAIAVATGEQRELDAIDLGDPHCPVAHVITVQALKEGWDCPFAYILCSVANVQSATSVEQLLGRVMRMPFARRRGREELNRAYAHVPETQFSRAAHALRDKLVDSMGFGVDEAAQAVQQVLADWPDDDGGGGEMAEPAAEVVQVDAAPDFSACTDEEREAVAQVVEVRRTDDGKSAVTVTGVLPPAAQEAIAAAARDENRREQIRARLKHKNTAFQKHQSPARRGEKFRPLPQFFIAFGGGEAEASPENIESVMAWEPLKQDYILGAGEFSIVETATGFKIDIGDEQTAELKIQESRQWEIPEIWGAPRAWDETQLALWLEREIRTRYLTQEVLAVFALHNVKALLDRGHSVEQLARFKFLLARRLKEKLEKLRVEAKEMNYRRVLFGASAPACRFQFEFRPDPRRYRYNSAYQGGYRFGKHYYGVIGDLKDRGEEYQCAVALDSMAEVEYWIRNVERKANSFWLPLPHTRFFPDFIAQLTDGRVLAVEYKGKHLATAEEAKIKKLIGELWERESVGKALFLMPTKRKDSPPVRRQIEQKVRAQSGGKCNR